MKQEIDIDNWVRKDQYHFFKQFEEPFWGVTITLDCTLAYQRAKQQGVSFFLYYLHQSLLAANQIAAFRYRILDDTVFLFDNVHASAVISRPDHSFGFSYLEYREHQSEFIAIAEIEINRIQQSKGLFPPFVPENVIHYSSLPWLDFTAISHARSFSFKDSCPKISFGKMTEHAGKKSMPVSIHVHHALMDGYDVGQYVACFQDLMNV